MASPSAPKLPIASAAAPRSGPRTCPARARRALPAEPLLAVDGLRVEFPTRRGTLAAVRDVSFDDRRRRDPRRGRGIGRRQVADRRGDHRPARAARAGSPPATIRLAGRRIDNLPYAEHAPDPRPRDRRGLPGPADLAQPAVHDRPAADRDDPHPPAGDRRPRRGRAAHRAARGSRHPGRRAALRPLSAPVLRRHAAAGRASRWRSPRGRSSSSPTSRRRRSTSRSRRRSSS